MKHQACLWGLLFALTLPCPAAVPSPDKLLAADTLVVITVPDFAKASGSLKQWPASRLWNDPAMRPFKDKFMAKVTADLVTPLEREFGVKLSDYTSLAQGQLTLAITQNGGTSQGNLAPGFLLLMDSKNKSDLLRTNLSILRKKWVDSGKQLKTEKIRDIEFTTLLFTSDDVSKTLEKVFPEKDKTAPDEAKDKKPAKKQEWLIGQSESLFILGSSAKDIEKVLIRQSGGSVPSLSEQASFAANHAALFRDGLGYGWVNLKAIVDALNKPGADEAGLKPDRLIAALGLGGLQSLAINLRDTPEGCLMNLLISIPEASRKGLLKALAFEAKDAAPPPFVPADAVKFTRWRLNLARTWTTLEATFTEALPELASGIKLIMDVAGKDKDPNFDLRKQVIAHLGDDIISYEKLPRTRTLEDLDSPPSLVLISSTKAEQLTSSLKSLASLLPQSSRMKEREFLGRTIYTIPLPPTSVPGRDKPLERSLNYAASGGYIAFSHDTALLEEHLRGKTGPALRELPGFAEAAQMVGGTGIGFFSFENQSETMRVTFETLKKESGSLNNLLGGSPLTAQLGMGSDDKKFADWVDFSLLPSYDQIAKYFYFNLWSGSVNSEGFNFKMFTPTPPPLKK